MVEIHGNDKFVCDGTRATKPLIQLFTANQLQLKTNISRLAGIGKSIMNSHMKIKSKIFLKSFSLSFRTLTNGTFSSDFHLYGLVWSASGLNFTIDNVAIGSIPALTGGWL